MIAWLAVVFGINSTRNTVNCIRLHLVLTRAISIGNHMDSSAIWE